MTTVLATFEDVAESYELPLGDPDRPRVEALLRHASARLVGLVPSIPARVEAGTLDIDIPGGMVIEAVLRVFRNPAGATEQQAGPFSRRFSTNASRNEIFFDPEQVHALLPGNDIAGVGTFKVGVPVHRRPVNLDADGRFEYTSENFEGYLSHFTSPMTP